MEDKYAGYYAQVDKQGQYRWLVDHYLGKLIEAGGCVVASPGVTVKTLTSLSMGYAAAAAFGKEYTSTLTTDRAFTARWLSSGQGFGESYKLTAPATPGHVRYVINLGETQATRAAGGGAAARDGDERFASWRIGTRLFPEGLPRPAAKEAVVDCVPQGWDGSVPKFMAVLDGADDTAPGWLTYDVWWEDERGRLPGFSWKMRSPRWLHRDTEHGNEVNIWVGQGHTATRVGWMPRGYETGTQDGLSREVMALGQAMPGVVMCCLNPYILGHMVRMNEGKMPQPMLEGLDDALDKLIEVAAATPMTEDGWKQVQRYSLTGDAWARTDGMALGRHPEAVTEAPKSDENDLDKTILDVARRWSLNVTEGKVLVSEQTGRRRALQQRLIMAQRLKGLLDNFNPAERWDAAAQVKEAKERGLITQAWLRSDLLVVEIPRLRFVEAEPVVYQGSTYAPGLYETPPTRMLICWNRPGREAYFFKTDGSRHWHPNAGMYDQGRPCWGHGDMAGPNAEMADYMWALGLIPFLEFVWGYLLADNPEDDYQPLVCCSTLEIPLAGSDLKTLMKEATR